MVHIDRVDIYGFKSFDFRNTAIRMEPGLVSISGPNGSGKSSVLDAIIFALGEKSPRILRVDKIRSVIHDIDKYDTDRSPQARVTVRISNRERIIPVDADKITVTRTVDRNNESSYFLNQKKVTRSRIHDVLEMGNSGISQLNIVQQGTITRISEFTPDERRQSIEELLGLSYFDEKKAQANGQLEAADRRLEIAVARLDEVLSRIATLEGERNYMMRHYSLQRELDRYVTIQKMQKLEREASRIHDMEKLLRDLDREIKSRNATLGTIQNDISDIESAKIQHDTMITESNRAAMSLRDELDRSQAQYHAAESDLKVAKRDKTLNENRLGDIRKRLQAIYGERLNIRPERERLRSDMAAAEFRRNDVAVQFRDVTQRYNDAMAQHNEVEAARADRERQLAILNDEILEHRNGQYRLDTDIRHIRQTITKGEDKLSQLHDLMISGQKNRDTLEEWLERHNDSMQSQSTKINELQKKIDSLDTRISQIDSLCDTVGQALSRYNTKLEMVKKVMHEDYAIGRLRLDAPNLGVLGLASELLHWEPEYERAVMASASDHLRALVVQDSETMEAIYQAARSLELPRIRVIPMDALAGSVSTGNTLAAHVSCEERFYPLRSLLFGGVMMAKSSHDAMTLAQNGMRAVTMDGHCIGTGLHIMDWGSDISDITGMIASRSYAESLESSVKSLQVIRRRLRSKVIIMRANHDEMSGNLSRLGSSVASANDNMKQLNARLEGARHRHNDTESELQKSRQRLPVILAELGKTNDMIGQIQGKIVALKHSIPANHDNTILQKVSQERESVERRRTEIISHYQNVKERYNQHDSNSVDLMHEAMKLAREQHRIMQENHALSEKIPSLAESFHSSRIMVEDIRQKQQESMQESNSSREYIQKCDKELTRLRAREREQHNILSKLQIRQNTMTRDMSQASLTCDKLQADIDASTSVVTDVDVNPEPFIESLQAEIESLPPLNGGAITSYNEVSEGYRKSSERRNILEQERNRIVSLIDDVEKEKRQKYLDAFDIVNREIQDIFGRMSGANAWLELESEDDIFESGIRYMVQFPDKPRRVSVSLSGGEKTLAAVVFVLALQKLRPSAFYLFDEVDAHLDALNSQRLANILHERARTGQFIIVSLKEFVVQKANLVCGIYHKKGVSKVVSYDKAAIGNDNMELPTLR